MASNSPWQASVVWVATRSGRFGRRSATAPLTIENSSTGENCKVARSPSLKGELVSCRTSQACATFCIQLPTCAAS